MFHFTQVVVYKILYIVLFLFCVVLYQVSGQHLHCVLMLLLGVKIDFYVCIYCLTMCYIRSKVDEERKFDIEIVGAGKWRGNLLL